MKVLMQDWYVPDKGALVSISKDNNQLDVTAKRITAKGGEVDGEPLEVEIPDDHEFVHMLRNGSVFLHHDEMDVIIYPDS